MTPDDDPNGTKGLVQGSVIVTQLVMPILVGWWLDGQYGWSPYGLATGAVLGCVGCGWAIWRLMKRTGTNDDQSGGKPPVDT